VRCYHSLQLELEISGIVGEMRNIYNLLAEKQCNVLRSLDYKTVQGLKVIELQALQYQNQPTLLFNFLWLCCLSSLAPYDIGLAYSLHRGKTLSMVSKSLS
jgi:hypothetical protein